MSGHSGVFRRENGRILFHTLRDAGKLDPEIIEVPEPESFNQANESGGLRHVESLEEVCEIAMHAADETKKFLGTPA